MSAMISEAGAAQEESGAGTVAAQAKDLLERGFTTTVAALDAVTASCCLEEALGHFEECLSVLEAAGKPLGVGLKEGYEEIVQRNEGRFEMAHGMDKGIFASDVVRNNAFALDLARQAIGPEAALYQVSLIMSLPGAKEQAWHADGGHVSMSEHLAPHVVNVFIPLVDVTRASGPTEFRPESHYYTRDLARMMLLAKVKKKIKPVEAPLLNAGGAVAFDNRVLHRGKANVGETRRPFLCLVFSQPWFKDIVNWPKRSIFKVEAKAAEGAEEQEGGDAAAGAVDGGGDTQQEKKAE